LRYFYVISIILSFPAYLILKEKASGNSFHPYKDT